MYKMVMVYPRRPPHIFILLPGRFLPMNSEK
jgi:hypothetical protein